MIPKGKNFVCDAIPQEKKGFIQTKASKCGEIHHKGPPMSERGIGLINLHRYEPEYWIDSVDAA
jgi:hypothetical protein